MKPLDEVLSESPESRFNLLKKTLVAHWIIAMLWFIVVIVTILVEKENPIFYAYGTTLGMSFLMLLYDIFASIIVYYDCKAWSVSRTGAWVIFVFLLGPIAFTIYYVHQKSQIDKLQPATSNEVQKIEDNMQEIKEEKELEYSETVTASKKTKKSSSDQTSWRDLKGIEEEIDKLHITKAKKPKDKVSKSVDKLLGKKK